MTDPAAVRPFSESRAARLARRLPVLLAALIAIVFVQNGPGLFVPDTINFLREGLGGNETLYPVIPPAFPLILDGICFFVPRPARMFVLVLLQQIGTVFAVWCTVRIAATAGRPWLTAVAGTVVATYVPLYCFAQTSQSESFYIAFSMASCWLAVRGWTRDCTRDFAWSGLLAGVAIAQRTVGYAIPAAVLLALLIGRTRRRLPRAALFLAGMVAVLGCFVAKNWLHHGHPIVVGGRGLHLFGRVAMVDKWLPDTPEAQRVREVSAKNGFPDPLFQNAGWRLQGWLQWGEGMPPRETDALLTKVAMQVHLTRPVQSLALTLREMANMARVADPMSHVLWNGLRPEHFAAHVKITDDVWGFDPEKLSATRARLTPYPGRPVLGERVYDVLETAAVVTVLPRGVWVIPAMILAWLLGVLLRDPTVLLAAGLPFAQMFATAIGDQPYERYWDPCVPPFVLAVLLALCGGVARWRSRRERVATVEPARGAWTAGDNGRAGSADRGDGAAPAVPAAPA